MTQVKLRQSGGSTIMAIPKAFAEKLGLQPDSPVEVDLVNDQLVIKPTTKRRSLASRLAECDFSAPMQAETSAWLDDKIIGREEI